MTTATPTRKPIPFPRPTRKPDRKAAIAALRMQEQMEDERLQDIVGRWYQRWGAEVQKEQKQREQKRQQERAKQEERAEQQRKQEAATQEARYQAYQDARMSGDWFFYLLRPEELE